MVAAHSQWLQNREDRIAHLTEIAYRAILERGYRGSFVELELSLWNTVRDAIDREPAGVDEVK